MKTPIQDYAVRIDCGGQSFDYVMEILESMAPKGFSVDDTRLNPNRPSWYNAPPWANYLAKDWDGEWTWYEFKPSLNEHYGADTWDWVRTEGKYQLAWHPIEIQDSLEKRP